ncbi:MAG TPA: DUF4010 domain-containing protein [Xanthobacteraceae bacterium]|jgi:uncharacterized membrane protein (DUF4010 family)|nr:DUF4010 domain-containing protein [Xanthobacteraceae bacterium]
MITTPSPASVALLLGLSFFLGLAFEEFFAHTDERRPGGIRTFPLLALVGGALYLFDQTHLIPFTGGLVVLGGWLFIYYKEHVKEHVEQPDPPDEPNVGLVVPLLNLLAYLLGAVALALPHWIAVTITVAAVLLLTGREKLHQLARRVEMREIVTLGEFLILTGIVLPLLPNHPVSTLTDITPRQVWLALIVVCTFSYISYLAQRYWAAAAQGLWMAALGGLYSSTATTVVLARQAKADPAYKRQAQAGITLATAIMYLRILAVVAIFNLALARVLALPMGALALAGFIICILQYRMEKPAAGAVEASGSQPSAPVAAKSHNPLELGAAAIFAALFVAVSVVSAVAKSQFGVSGIYGLAAIVGVTDIDPFVLNLAQGGVTGVSNGAIAAAILIAASSNNFLKALYAAFFAGGKATFPSAIALVALAAAGIAAAIGVAHF